MSKNTSTQRGWDIAVRGYGAHLQTMGEYLQYIQDNSLDTPAPIIVWSFKYARDVGVEDDLYVQSIRLRVGDNGSLQVEAKSLPATSYFISGMAPNYEYKDWPGCESLTLSREEIIRHLDPVSLFMLRRYNRQRGFLFRQTQTWIVKVLMQETTVDGEVVSKKMSTVTTPHELTISKEALQELICKVPAHVTIVLGVHYLQLNDVSGPVNIVIRPTDKLEEVRDEYTTSAVLTFINGGDPFNKPQQ